MPSDFNIVLTKVGQQALWNARNSGVELDLTHIQLGTSSANLNKEYESIALSNAVKTIGIEKSNRINDEQIRIYSTISGSENHLITEIGVWSGDPSKSGSVLFAYVVSTADDPLTMISKVMNVVFSLDLVFSGQDLSNVTIVIDENQSLVLSMFASHTLDEESHPYYAYKDRDNTFFGDNTFTKTIEGTAKHAINSDNATHADGADFAMTVLTADEAEETFTLKTARKIHGVDFDGSEDIELPIFSTENSGLVPQTTESDKFLRSDGTWQIVEVGEAEVETAERLKTARNISISGAITGTATAFDGSQDIEIEVISADGAMVVGYVPNADNVESAITADTATTATTATTVDVLETARLFSAVGAVETNEVAFDGSDDVEIEVKSIDGSKVIGSVPEIQKLESVRKIQSVYFDGSQDIEIPIFSYEDGGFVPQTTGETDYKFLCADGTWKEGTFSGGLSKDQEWRDVTSQRVAKTNYFNEDEKRFAVIDLTRVNPPHSFEISKDGEEWQMLTYVQLRTNIFAMIPPLTFYRLGVTSDEAEIAPLKWVEFRKWGETNVK